MRAGSAIGSQHPHCSVSRRATPRQPRPPRAQVTPGGGHCSHPHSPHTPSKWLGEGPSGGGQVPLALLLVLPHPEGSCLRGSHGDACPAFIADVHSSHLLARPHHGGVPLPTLLRRRLDK